MLSIDLCAGSGWTVACQWLGIDDLGIEIMPEAIRTRDAMGALTLLDADGKGVGMEALPDTFCAQAPIQIAGPPCQTFSPAGSGEGRAQIGEILRRIDVLARTGHLERGGTGDPRTWLVLEPLRLLLGGLPTYFVWEQVPGVLPVWQACEPVIRAAGYSTVSGIIRAEQYGVPQTRRRAIILGRRDGLPAAFPPVTHSRYHERSPERLDDGVLPWVSMAEALGWAEGDRMGFPRADDQGGDGYRERDLFPATRPAPVVVGKSRSWQHWQISNSQQENGTHRDLEQPAPTIHSSRIGNLNWVYRNGTGANAAVRPVGAPAPTIHFGARANGVDWVQTRPATTVQGDPRIAAPGHKDRSNGGQSQMSGDSIRVTVAEAAALQTFPPGHPFQGSMTKQFLQIGNAVPPLLAWHILRTFLP